MEFVNASPASGRAGPLTADTPQPSSIVGRDKRKNRQARRFHVILRGGREHLRLRFVFQPKAIPQRRTQQPDAPFGSFCEAMGRFYGNSGRTSILSAKLWVVLLSSLYDSKRRNMRVFGQFCNRTVKREDLVWHKEFLLWCLLWQNVFGLCL